MMRLRVTITREITASPDHICFRLYQVGEQHQVGTYLMPQPLAERLVEGLQTPAAEIDSKPVDQEWLEQSMRMISETNLK